MTKRARIASPTHKETRSGRLVDLLNPTIDDIDLGDIIWSLANTIRFGGHADQPAYTNCQHSSVVGHLVPPPIRVYGFIHDFPEAYTSDLLTPFKKAMQVRCPGFDTALREMEEPFEALICEKLGIPLPSEAVRAEVKKADLIALATEQRDIMKSPNDWGLPYPPMEEVLRPIEPKWARWGLIRDFHEIGIEINVSRGLS